jgi:hypothetical protein
MAEIFDGITEGRNFLREKAGKILDRINKIYRIGGG